MLTHEIELRLEERLVAPSPGEATARARATPLLETRRAVHRLVGAGLERHAGNPAAARAHRLEHLPRSARGATVVATRVPTTIALGSACSAAVATSCRLTKATARVEVLLAAGERKPLAAIAA